MESSTKMTYSGRLEDYEEIRQLGSGIYGDIHLCNRKIDNEIVCVKHIDVTHLNKDQRESCWNEVRVCERLQHPNIISYHSAFLDTKHGQPSVLAIVMEYCDGGDLAQWLYAHHLDIDDTLVLTFFIQISLGLHHMHANRILHRDLKPKNIFVFENGRVVIGDFGISKCLDASNGLAQTLVGSPAYMCPEIFEGKSYEYKADVWSLGCVLYELLTNKSPFRAGSYPELVQKITTCDYEPLPLTMRLPLRNLVSSMLSLRYIHILKYELLGARVEDRPSVDEILNLAFLRPYVDAITATASEQYRDSQQGEHAERILREQLECIFQSNGTRSHVNFVEAMTPPLPSTVVPNSSDIKAFVKSKRITTTDKTMDSRAIVQLRALQSAQRYKKKENKPAIDLPLCEIHVQELKFPSRANFPPATFKLKQNNSKKLLIPDEVHQKPKSPRHRPITIRGVSPPPPPIVGVRPAQLPLPIEFGGLSNQVDVACMEVVGIQLKSASKNKQQ